MKLRPYTGLSPQRVSKDAKYTATVGGAIRLEFQESRRVRILLTTEDHPKLTEMVNEVKRHVPGREGKDGGAFYINEYQDVLVPSGDGGACFWAGNYEGTLEFSDGPLQVSPKADPDLEPGDFWPGPHVGIPYVLIAGASDIRYEKVDGRRRETVLLSDFCGPAASRTLGQRLARYKGSSGGRFFINERAELFGPVATDSGWDYIYFGNLDEDQWFPAPSGFPRP